MMVLWIRLTGSVFVSKMSNHDVSPRESIVITNANHDDPLSKVKSSSYKVSVSHKLYSYKRAMTKKIENDGAVLRICQ